MAKRMKGGAPRSKERKVIKTVICFICKRRVSKRKTKSIGWWKGEEDRACKHHPGIEKGGVVDECRKDSSL